MDLNKVHSFLFFLAARTSTLVGGDSMTINDIISSLQWQIRWYEEHEYKILFASDRKKKFDSIFQRFDYEANKIKLDIAQKMNDVQEYKRICSRLEFDLYRIKPKFRKTVCCLATNGRTFKVSELNEEETAKATEMLNQMVDNFITRIKEP